MSSKVTDMETEILKSVICCGTGKEAATGGFAAGKTGTTENYGDAWFVGFNKELTVAVWVGYPDKLQPMETEYRGSQVAGGTFPAEIWHDFMTSWIGIRESRDLARLHRRRERDPEPARGRARGQGGPRLHAARPVRHRHQRGRGR